MNGTVQTVASWGDAIFVALTGALNDVLGFVPRLLGALVILLVGWLLAKAVDALVSKGLRAVRFNQVADRAELDQFLDTAGVRLDPAAVVGKLAYWFLFLIFIGAAFNAFGLTQVNAVINQIIAYLPNVVVALVVLLVGALLATFVANLVRGASGSARVGDPNLLAGLARAAVLAFAVIIALNQLQIGAAIVNTLFMALVGIDRPGGGPGLRPGRARGRRPPPRGLVRQARRGSRAGRPPGRRRPAGGPLGQRGPPVRRRPPPRRTPCRRRPTDGAVAPRRTDDLRAVTRPAGRRSRPAARRAPLPRTPRGVRGPTRARHRRAQEAPRAQHDRPQAAPPGHAGPERRGPGARRHRAAGRRLPHRQGPAVRVLVRRADRGRPGVPHPPGRGQHRDAGRRPGARRVEAEGDVRVQVHEERLEVDTRERQTGEVRVTTTVDWSSRPCRWS